MDRSVNGIKNTLLSWDLSTLAVQPQQVLKIVKIGKYSSPFVLNFVYNSTKFY
jgi:hypothetical protein